MKSSRRFFIVVSSLVVFLLGSVALNYYLFQQSQSYYLQLNMEHLDPLGLDCYPTSPDQREPTDLGLRTIVFFGDSQAANWPAPEISQFKFINRGVGAQTSEQALLRFDYHVAPLHPEIIVVQVGINDLKTIPLLPQQKESIIANCQADIRQIADKSTTLGAKVVLTTIFPVGKVPLERRLFWSDDVAQAVERVNADIRSLQGENIVVFDAYSVLVGSNGAIDPKYSQDLLHLNPAGYKKLNEAFIQFIKTLR